MKGQCSFFQVRELSGLAVWFDFWFLFFRIILFTIYHGLYFKSEFCPDFDVWVSETQEPLSNLSLLVIQNDDDLCLWVIVYIDDSDIVKCFQERIKSNVQ